MYFVYLISYHNSLEVSTIYLFFPHLLFASSLSFVQEEFPRLGTERKQQTLEVKYRQVTEPHCGCSSVVIEDLVLKLDLK